jgi:tRNA(His) guanylyltransferase
VQSLDFFSSSLIMAKSRYEYVRTYERDEVALPTTYMVVRIDGKGFHRFSTRHRFDKPNDRRALDLMNAAARKAIESEAGQGIVLAFGESDEYSFVYGRTCALFGRRTRYCCPLRPNTCAG